MANGIIPTDGMVLLWTNGSPTSSFSAQTVSLDLSKYTHVCISKPLPVETMHEMGHHRKEKGKDMFFAALAE